MRAFTVAGKMGALWDVIAALAFLVTGLEPSHLLVPWAAVAISWTVAEGAKFLFNRARPFISDTEIAPLIKTPSSSSFPSGHSATARRGLERLGDGPATRGGRITTGGSAHAASNMTRWPAVGMGTMTSRLLPRWSFGCRQCAAVHRACGCSNWA